LTEHCERWTAARWVFRTFLLCLLLVSSPAVRGQETPADWTIDTFRWNGPLAPSTLIEVVNPYGDVRLRESDPGEVVLSAMIQRRTKDPVKPEVKVERHRDRLRIEAVYPVAPRGDLHRVDIAVLVPEGARVVARTRNGMIEARGLANDLDFESAGGDVKFSTTGTARVSAVKGNITADLRGRRWDRAPRLVTREGNITLRLPADADARVRIRAPGKILVSRPAQNERRTFWRTIVTFGHGSRSLSLTTKRGDVTLVAP